MTFCHWICIIFYDSELSRLVYFSGTSAVIKAEFAFYAVLLLNVKCKELLLVQITNAAAAYTNFCTCVVPSCFHETPGSVKYIYRYLIDNTF